jgi:hypothetical protein
MEKNQHTTPIMRGADFTTFTKIDTAAKLAEDAHTLLLMAFAKLSKANDLTNNSALETAYMNLVDEVMPSMRIAVEQLDEAHGDAVVVI